jgi:hypothetical protein
MRLFSWRTPGNSRAHYLALFDYVLDHRLTRGVLRTAILFGYQFVQMADETIVLI